MDIQPLSITEGERKAARRYAEAIDGSALASAKREAGDAFRTGISTYLLIFIFAYFSYDISGQMAQTGVNPEDIPGHLVGLFALLFGSPLALAIGNWLWRGHLQRKRERLSLLRRLPEEQTIVDDPTEALTYRVIRVIDAYNEEVQRMAVEYEGVAVGDLQPDAHRDARASCLAELRPTLDLCIRRMRFWRNPFTRSAQDGTARPRPTSSPMRSPSSLRRRRA